ncbi:MAG: NAD(P)/FAD-dependent oxidoreductase, partial [Mangrovicoccus sp.]
MKFEPYWHATAPRFDQAQSDAVQGHYDVAVIGGGFTGLNAARRLAKNGVRVALLEAAHIGAGGSGRNGGHLNNGIAHGYGAAKLHLGAERAKALYQAFDRSIDMIEELIAEEGIDCNFRRCGKLKLASKPSHAAGLKANYELIHKEVDAQTDWIERDGLRTEVGGQDFHGGVLYRKTAMMHMGRYVHGLGQACARHGVDIWEEEPLIARKKIAKGWELSTPKGKLTAERV